MSGVSTRQLTLRSHAFDTQTANPVPLTHVTGPLLARAPMTSPGALCVTTRAHAGTRAQGVMVMRGVFGIKTRARG